MRVKSWGFKFFSLIVLFSLAGCASAPSSYFRLTPVPPQAQVKVAIIPLTNLTQEKDADRKIVYSLMTNLLSSDYFAVVEMGETEKVLEDIKVSREGGLSVEEIKKIGQATGAEVLLMGAVEEYKIDSGTMLGEKVFVPEFSLSVRLVSTKDASIIWAVNHHRRGDDQVTLFGLGRIDSMSKLTDVIIKDIVHSLVNVVKTRREAIAILKNGKKADIVPTPVLLEVKPQEVQPPVKEVAIPALEVKPQPAQTEGTVTSDSEVKPQEVSQPKAEEVVTPVPEAKPQDLRQQIKEEYNSDYETIKKQY